MDGLMKSIDEALERRGLSDAAASQLAVGHPSFIKNLRNRRGGQRLHPVEAMLRLIDVLDLKMTITPKDHIDPAPPILGLAQTCAVLNNPMLEFGVDQLFVPVPFNSLAPGPNRGMGPIAFSKDWLDELGLSPDKVSFIIAEGEAMKPAIKMGATVLIDNTQTEPIQNAEFAVVYDGKTNPHRVILIDDNHIGLSSNNFEQPPIIVKRQNLKTTHRIIGRIVWSGQRIKATQ